MPISDDDLPPRPPSDRPPPEQSPPSDEPGWIDPGLQPGDPVLPQPEPEPEPEPEYEPVGFLLLDESELSKKYQTYGGVGSNCRSRTTEWSDMATAPYWLEGSVQASMSGSTVTLATGALDSWMPTDALSVVVAENSYINLNVTYSASEAVGYQGLQDTSFSFAVCLEGGDSVNVAVGESSVQNFSIVKNGVECLNDSEISAANAIWTEFSISITITKAVHCAGASEAEPDQWTQEPPIDDAEDSDSSQAAGLGIEWTQSDSWVLLGAIVLLLLGGYVLNTVKGGGDCD